MCRSLTYKCFNFGGGKYIGVKWLDHMVSGHLRNKLFFQSDCTIFYFYQHCMRLLVLSHSYKHVVRLQNLSHSKKPVVVSHYSFNLHFLYNERMSIFLNIWVICIYFSINCWYLLPSFLLCFCPFLLTYRNIYRI